MAGGDTHRKSVAHGIQHFQRLGHHFRDVYKRQVLEQRHLAQVREQRKIQRQRKVGAVKPDIALDLSFMPSRCICENGSSYYNTAANIFQRSSLLFTIPLNMVKNRILMSNRKVQFSI